MGVAHSVEADARDAGPCYQTAEAIGDGFMDQRLPIRPREDQPALRCVQHNWLTGLVRTKDGNTDIGSRGRRPSTPAVVPAWDAAPRICDFMHNATATVRCLTTQSTMSPLANDHTFIVVPERYPGGILAAITVSQQDGTQTWVPAGSRALPVPGQSQFSPDAVRESVPFGVLAVSPLWPALSGLGGVLDGPGSVLMVPCS